VVALVAGAVSLLIGWIGSSDTVYPAQQIPFLISGGLVGVVLIGVGSTLWLSADLRDEWRKLDEIQEILLGDDRAAPAAAPDRADTIAASPRTETAVR
jgi:hypothetical protein